MPSPYEKEFKPPRPRNAWIIFRTDQLKLRQPAPGARPQLQAHASKDIAKIWKNLSPEVRAEYERRAAEEKAEHERRYPNYKYKPRSKADKEREREEKKAEKLRKKEEAKRARLQLPQATYAYGPQLSYYAAAAAMVSAPEDLPSPPLSLASPLPDASTPSSVGSSMIRQASSSGSSRNVSQSNSPASSSRHTLDNDESIAPRAVAYLERKKASKVASGRENGPGSLHEELSWMLNQFPLQSQDTIQPYAAASSASAAIAPPPLTNLEQQAMLSTVPQMQSEFSYEHNWIIPRSDASQLQASAYGLDAQPLITPWPNQPTLDDPLHALLHGTDIPGVFDISGTNTAAELQSPHEDIAVDLNVTPAMSPVVDDNNNNNNVSNDVWLSLFHMFLEKTSGETAAPTTPAPGSSSSSDTLLTPPTPQEAIASNEFAMNAFFNFEDDMTALPGNSLPISQDNFFQSDMQCMNNYLAAPTAHPFTNCLNPAQLLQPMPISALPPLPHLSMPTFGQTPPMTPSPSSSISPSDLLAAASAPTMFSTSSDEAGYRPPSGAMNATARRVGGSWRVPQAFENVSEGPSSVETQPLTHQTSMYWGMARQ